MSYTYEYERGATVPDRGATHHRALRPVAHFRGPGRGGEAGLGLLRRPIPGHTGLRVLKPLGSGRLRRGGADGAVLARVP